MKKQTEKNPTKTINTERITFTGPGCHPRLWPHFLHIFLLGLMKTFTRLLWHVKGFRLFVCLFVICFYLCLVLHNTMWKSSINSANWCNLSQRLRPQWFRDWSCHLRISANKIKLADTAIWHPYCCPADKGIMREQCFFSRNLPCAGVVGGGGSVLVSTGLLHIPL